MDSDLLATRPCILLNGIQFILIKMEATVKFRGPVPFRWAYPSQG
ncbi:unnamed protein product [Penicillium camemberti]|uniref:Str. FM013 n=1 Tax=Penicillium camemberti (strain FM 013) TaxID=1429867 RepID=A0A0G4PRD7_PENC3|nr:unnamed protein product [Penicillium camemberti]